MQLDCRAVSARYRNMASKFSGNSGLELNKPITIDRSCFDMQYVRKWFVYIIFKRWIYKMFCRWFKSFIGNWFENDVMCTRLKIVWKQIVQKEELMKYRLICCLRCNHHRYIWYPREKDIVQLSLSYAEFLAPNTLNVCMEKRRTR